MKLKHIALGMIIAGCSAASFAAPDSNTPYVGAKIGWSHYFNTDFEKSGVTDRYDFSRDRFAAGAYGGYQFTPYIGIEVGYDWLGKSNFRLHDNARGAVTDAGTYGAQGLYAAGKFSYPVTNQFDVYTRLGAYGWRSNLQFTDYYNSGINYDRKTTGVSPLFAGGVEYAFTPDWAARVDYQYVPNIGKRSEVGIKPDNGLLSVGLSYRFGQGQPAPAPVVQEEPKLETKRFNLRSDVLFAFAKAELKPQGQAALDNLYSELRNIDPDEGHVVVIGFTDRIGSAASNQVLSERRAQTVVNYLVQKGIPQNLIQARGMGLANPVTGTQCDNVTPRAALIECLGPDRRVEIEVSGLKTVQQ